MKRKSIKKKTYLDKTISTILSWGISGAVVLILLAASPFAGAAAMTSTLAFLGGPLGMLGGILITIPAMIILSKKGADYIIPKIREDMIKNYRYSELEKFIDEKVKSGVLKKKAFDVLKSIYKKEEKI